MIATFAASTVVIRITNVWLLSAINLYVFSLLLSIVVAASVLMLIYGESFFLKINLSSSKYKLLGAAFLISMAIFLIYLYSQAGLGTVVFSEWNTLPVLLLVFSLFVFLAGLYVPAYVLHYTLLKRFNFGLIERIVFYPLISALVLGSLRVFLVGINYPLVYEFIFVCFLIIASCILLRSVEKNSHNLLSEPLSVDLVRVLTIFSVIVFSLFLFYSAISLNGFLVGDMWGDAQKVSLITTHGAGSVFSSPVASGYPPYFCFFWSVLTQFLPIPLVNGLIVTAFFNHAFSVLALFLLARFIFKDNKAAVLSALLWTMLSDFSWIGVTMNSPGSVLTGDNLLIYITNLFSRFGFYSGSRVSTIYADGHALTRLWSLGLFFASAAAIMKICYDKKHVKEGLFVLSIGILQILLGHMIEVPVLSIILLVSFIILKPDPKFYKLFILAFGSLAGLSCFFAILTFGLNYVYILISISPLISLLSAILILAISKQLSLHFHSNKPTNSIFYRRIIITLSIVLIFLYGLMWLAFVQKGGNLTYAIATIWYLPAIEWGFLGLVAITTLVWFGLRKMTLNLGLKITLSIIGAQLILLLFLNILNYNLFYIENPYPFDPILFLPFLALVVSQFLIAFKFQKFSKIKLLVFTSVLILLFSFASLDNILNTSYNATYGGWWSSTSPTNLSTDDYALMNFLYNSTPIGPYEFVGTFDDWINPSIYVVYPSGMTVLSPPLINILSTTTDSRELYELTHTFPINYVLTSKDQPFGTSQYLTFNGYSDYAKIEDSNSMRTSNAFTVEFWVVLHSIASNNQDIFSQRTLSNKVLVRRMPSDEIVFYFWLNGEETDLTIPPLTRNIPYHLAITYDQQTGYVKVYENGLLVSKAARSGQIATDDMTITLGRYSNGDAYYFDGMLSALKLYKRALSDQEIYQTYLHNDGIYSNETILNLPMNASTNNLVNDLSGNGNNAILLGPTITTQSAALVSLIKSTQPVFSNNKYEVYELSSMNLPQTALLNTTGFLTFEHITIRGNLTLNDKLNGQLNYVNGEFIMSTGDNGTCVLTVTQQGTVVKNVTTLTPTVTINGDISFLDMKSSWGYFTQISCMSDNLTISGTTSFNVANTFANRVYAINLSYSGHYVSYPEPDYVRADYLRTQIDDYYAHTYISPWSIILTPIGIFWAFVNVFLLIFFIWKDKLRLKWLNH